MVEHAIAQLVGDAALKRFQDAIQDVDETCSAGCSLNGHWLLQHGFSDVHEAVLPVVRLSAAHHREDAALTPALGFWVLGGL